MEGRRTCGQWRHACWCICSLTADCVLVLLVVDHGRACLCACVYVSGLVVYKRKD